MIGLPGQLAGPTGEPLLQQGPAWRGVRSALDVEARVNENATPLVYGDVACAGLPVGPGVLGNCRPMASGGMVLGLTLHQDDPEPDGSGNYQSSYPHRSTVPILRIGYIWALAAEDVNAEDACVGVIAVPGAVGSSTGGAADGVTRLAFPAGWTWKRTVRAGCRGLIRAFSA